jgi:prepilin-type N-terminal cleavage/methylation domain-containing protein
VSPQRRTSEAGFTFVEVMLAMVLMLVVFAATLTIFTTVERGYRNNQALNVSQSQARQATDTLAARLRNLASPSNGTSQADQQPLERAEAQDLVFRTVKQDGAPTALNPQNLERYRYCLGPDKVL